MNKDSDLIKHIFKDLLHQIMKKYEFTTQEAFILFEAKKIMLNKAKEILKNGQSKNNTI
ncbi:MAG: hypothetical protein V1901_04080 [Patescibacteria group bacterium]